MSEENKQKTNFFKECFKSIKDLDKYEDFALESPKKAFNYIFKLILIFCALICILYTYQIVQNANDIYANLKNEIPEFSYKEGSLTVNSEQPIIIEDYQEVIGKVVIDTNANVDKYEKDAKTGIVLLVDKIVILSDNGMGQVAYKYEEIAKNYGITEFTKQDAINYIEGINIVSLCGSIYFVMFVYLFILYFISIFIDVLWLSILTYIVSRISNIRLKFAPSFGIASHALTLPVILNLIYIIVNLFTGFEIKYFRLMYSTISYIYIIVAILMIKTDFIQRQMELIKLAQEQEKVREEMKQQEEKEKEKEENKKPEGEQQEEKNSKRKKKKEDDGTGANAPACEELGKEVKEQG